MMELDTTSTDALHWAEQFSKTYFEKTGHNVDSHWLGTWFANYWAAIHDPLVERIDELEALVAEIPTMCHRYEKHIKKQDELIAAYTELGK
jgi:hypothetical protein